MAEEQKPQQQIQMRIDDTRSRTTYANAFRHSSNPQEVILDFGINVINPRPAEDGKTQMNFQIDNRLVMNYVTAKRLAGMLGQLIQAHEQRFGEIKTEQPVAEPPQPVGTA